MVVAVLIGAVAGAFNGFLVAFVGLPSLAVTIGTLALFRGLALVIIGDNAVADFPRGLTTFFTSKIGGTGIPTVMVGVAAIALFFGVLLHLTPFGRGLYAMGFSKEAARFVGIKVARAKFWLYVASGAVAAMAGVYWTLRYSSARSDNASGLELAVIASVLLGGVSIFGGQGLDPRGDRRRPAHRDHQLRTAPEPSLRRGADHRHRLAADRLGRRTERVVGDQGLAARPPGPPRTPRGVRLG